MKDRLFKIYKNVLSVEDYLYLKLAGRKVKENVNKEDPFFIIGIPGSLHIMELSLSYIPSYVNKILIFNGMEKWEKDWAREHFNSDGWITVDRIVSHGKILDMLFDNYPMNFGILDYDCFVFNSDYFKLIKKINKNQMMNAFFSSKNEKLDLEFAETFFLFFNTKNINFLRGEFNINCTLQKFDKKLNEKVKQQLKKIGIVDELHYPEENKHFFDTMKLIMSVGISKNFQINFVKKFPPRKHNYNDIYHVGSVSKPNSLKTNYQRRGAYFWYRALESNVDKELKARYWEKYGYIDSGVIIERYPESKSTFGKAFFDFVDFILS